MDLSLNTQGIDLRSYHATTVSLQLEDKKHIFGQQCSTSITSADYSNLLFSEALLRAWVLYQCTADEMSNV